jgi:NADP-dependent 3-hydroxy acid dehydrogenase YdfG
MQGLHIAIFDISEAVAMSVLSSLRQEFPAAKFVFQKCDVSKWEDQKAAFEKTFQEFGHFDIVIANAGISESKPDFLSKDEAEPEKPTFTTLNVNLTGMLYSKPTIN